MKTSAITEKKPSNRVSKKKRGVASKIFTVIAVLLVALLTLSFISPLPVAMLIRFAFRNGNAVAPDNYEVLQAQVAATKDLVYPSSHKSNLADIYCPKDSIAPLPVVLWIHGGAYVGGDKKDVEIYATALASEGFAVVCINYERAPEAKYPVPVVQTGEAYVWLCDIAAEYSLDIERLIIAGDSAGAHIAAQFTAIQTSAAYAAEMEMEQLVPVDALKSVLLFCGPYDSEKITSSDNMLVNYFLGSAAWAYFGSRSWETKYAKQASIGGYITPDFPPTFITDGNKLSFEDHARDLAEVLERNSVPVEAYFIAAADETAYHEYQFVMNTAPGMDAFQKMLGFIKRYTA